MIGSNVKFKILPDVSVLAVIIDLVYQIRHGTYSQIGDGLVDIEMQPIGILLGGPDEFFFKIIKIKTKSNIFSGRSPTVYAGSEIKSLDMTIGTQSIDAGHIRIPMFVGHIEVAENIQDQIRAVMLFEHIKTTLHQLMLQQRLAS